MNNSVQTIPEMKAIHDNPSSDRGAQWFALLSHGFTKQNAIVPSVLVADGEYENRACRLIAVVPDLNNHFPRAVNGEVGLLESMALAREVNAVVEADAHSETKRALVLIVDVPSQAYGRREETLGIHQALASAVSAYANARQNGHPIIALLVGKAMSGAYLAHGYQANRIIALSDEGVMVHAMGKAAAARVTQRTEAELDQLAAENPPMAYDLKSYASLGLIDNLLQVESATQPTPSDKHSVEQAITDALLDIQPKDTGISRRLSGEHRQASRQVRDLLKAQWTGA